MNLIYEGVIVDFTALFNFVASSKPQSSKAHIEVHMKTKLPLNLGKSNQRVMGVNKLANFAVKVQTFC